MKLGSIVLGVRDLDRSRRWYESHLGLRAREIHAESRLLRLEVGSAVALCLCDSGGVGGADANVRPDGEGVSQKRDAAFPVFLVDDVTATRVSLEASGTTCEPIVEDVVCRRFSVYDPDGNRIDLVELLREPSGIAARFDGPQVASDMTVAFSADQPGTLARALEALTRAGMDTGGYAEIEGYFHLLVPDPDVARHAFEEAGFRVEGDQQVLIVDLASRPGSTADLFRKVADAGVNVAFTYATADGRLVIGTREVDRLRSALQAAENSEP